MNGDIYALGVLVLIGIGIIVSSFTILGSIAIWKSNSKGAEIFNNLFERGDLLKIITVGWIVIAVGFLALAKIADAPLVIAVLSGIAGFVLGREGRLRIKRESKYDEKANPQLTGGDAKSIEAKEPIEAREEIEKREEEKKFVKRPGID